MASYVKRDKKGRMIIEIKDYSTCYYCKQNPLNQEEKFCPNCGFPQQGTENEQRHFIVDMRKKQSALKEMKEMMKRATRWLFWIAIINLLLAFVNTSSTSSSLFIGTGTIDILNLVVQLIVGGVYLWLAFWSKTKPFPAFLTGLIVYVTFFVLERIIVYVTDTGFVISFAVVIKIVIIGALFSGLKSARKAERLRAELGVVDFVK